MITRSAMSFVLLLAVLASSAQSIEKVYFNPSDSGTGYYLAIRPQSGVIGGTLLLMNSFSPPEAILPETRLHNVAYVNDLLTVYVSMGMKLYADENAVGRINAVVKDLETRFHIDAAQVVLAGFSNAGNIALRYTELANAQPASYPMHPRAVFAADSQLDIQGLWHWCERQIKKNFHPGAVGDARAFLDIMTKEQGTLAEKSGAYQYLSSFSKDVTGPGNEQWLVRTPVRLYYDTDIQWQLANRRNSLYDTNIPDATEMVDRLLLMGNSRAEFVSARQPGMRSNGVRHPGSLSIVDPVDCIQWVKGALDIFDPVSWRPPYTLPVPAGWSTERFALPPDFAQGFSFKGVEELRFHPGWAEAGNEGYWTYAYLWWIGEGAVVDAGTLAANFRSYYDGLVGRNIASRHIPADKVFPASATLKKTAAKEGDRETYEGEIRMLDYMGQRPQVLHCRVHVKDAGALGKKAVFVEVSPQAYGHGVWKKMDGIVEGFVF